jgi:hypothetical protein
LATIFWTLVTYEHTFFNSHYFLRTIIIQFSVCTILYLRRLGVNLQLEIFFTSKRKKSLGNVNETKSVSNVQTWMWILIMQRGEKCVNCFSTFCLIYALLHLHGKQNWWDILDGAKYEYHGINRQLLILCDWIRLFFFVSRFKKEKKRNPNWHILQVLSRGFY